MKNKSYKSKLTEVQFDYVRANKDMTALAISKVINVKLGSVVHARWVIREVEVPVVNKKFFDIESYSKTLITI